MKDERCWQVEMLIHQKEMDNNRTATSNIWSLRNGAHYVDNNIKTGSVLGKCLCRVATYVQVYQFDQREMTLTRSDINKKLFRFSWNLVLIFLEE